MSIMFDVCPHAVGRRSREDEELQLRDEKDHRVLLNISTEQHQKELASWRTSLDFRVLRLNNGMGSRLVSCYLDENMVGTFGGVKSLSSARGMWLAKET